MVLIYRVLDGYLTPHILAHSEEMPAPPAFGLHNPYAQIPMKVQATLI
jgi:hypothetical protein